MNTHTKKNFIAIGAILLLLMFPACKTASKMESSLKETATNNNVMKKAEGITERHWKLVEINGEKVVMDGIGSRTPYMILKQEDNRVNGNGGCNSFFGSYTLEDGNRIKFSQLGATQMACISNAEIEPKFFRVLEMADNYNLKGDTLTLNRARMAPLARFEAVYLY